MDGHRADGTARERSGTSEARTAREGATSGRLRHSASRAVSEIGADGGVESATVGSTGIFGRFHCDGPQPGGTPRAELGIKLRTLGIEWRQLVASRADIDARETKARASVPSKDAVDAKLRADRRSIHAELATFDAKLSEVCAERATVDARLSEVCAELAIVDATLSEVCAEFATFEAKPH